MLRLFIILSFLVASMGAQAGKRAERNNWKSFLFHTRQPQKMSVYNVGFLSLQKRLDMIASAKKTIEAEFFIYRVDEAGRIFTQALIKKAREGVKVRVLVDHGWPVPVLDKHYAQMLKKNNIEVRYYNPSFALDVYTGQFRSHRKALIVDDQVGMTGGRNIADEYFDMALDYNFLDRDIVVEGEMARAMRESFDDFWYSDLTKAPGGVFRPRPEWFGAGSTDATDIKGRVAQKRYEDALEMFIAKQAKAADYGVENEKDRETLRALKAAWALNSQVVQTHVCTDSFYAADLPGIGASSRVLWDVIREKLSNTQKSMHIESPYFITTLAGIARFKQHIDRGLEISVYTNSLNSTDEAFTSGVFYPRVGFLVSAGLNIFIYKGDAPENQDFVFPPVAKARFGIHGKSVVLDEMTTIIGTFNMDPRSRNINAEMAVMCMDNPALAAEVIGDMKVHQRQSLQLNENGQPADGSSRYQNVSIPKRIMFVLSAPFANLLSFLL